MEQISEIEDTGANDFILDEIIGTNESKSLPTSVDFGITLCNPPFVGISGLIRIRSTKLKRRQALKKEVRINAQNLAYLK